MAARSSTPSHPDAPRDPLGVGVYRRVNALVLCAPAGLSMFDRDGVRVPYDVARLRVASDEPVTVGDRLRLEVFPHGAGGTSLRIIAEVAWIHDCPDELPARFEVGLVVKTIARDDAASLAVLLA